MTARKSFRVLGALIAAAALLPIVAWGTWLLVERSRLGAVEARIRAEGLATTLEQVLPPPVAPEDNAAPLIEEAAAQLEALKESGFAVRFPGAGNKDTDPLLFDEEKLEELKAQMASPEVQAVLKLLREASAKPACRFERDYSQGMFMEVGGMTALLQGAKLLALSARLQAMEKKSTGAMEDVLAITRLANFGLEDSLVLGWLVGVTTDLIGIGAGAGVLGEFSPDHLPADLLRQLGRQWATHAAEARKNSARAIDAERVFFTGWVFQTIYRRQHSLAHTISASMFIEPAQPPIRWRLIFWAYEYPLYPLMLADHRAFLESMLALRERILGGPSADLPAEDTDIVDHIPSDALLTRMALPGLAKLRPRLDEYEVELQVAQVGLALEEWRARHADYPATLEELGLPPEMLRDPFSDQPLIYRRTPDGVTVYSVGKDRTDNGGIRRKNDQPGDVVWSVQRTTP